MQAKWMTTPKGLESKTPDQAERANTWRALARTAFRMHKQGKLSESALENLLRTCLQQEIISSFEGHLSKNPRKAEKLTIST